MATIFTCEWMRQAHDYRTECGFRGAGYNKHWIVCPYCGRHIHIINKKFSEGAKNEIITDNRCTMD